MCVLHSPRRIWTLYFFPTHPDCPTSPERPVSHSSPCNLRHLEHSLVPVALATRHHDQCLQPTDDPWPNLVLLHSLPDLAYALFTAGDNVLSLIADVLMGGQKNCEFSNLKSSIGSAYLTRNKTFLGIDGVTCWEVRLETSNSAGSALLFHNLNPQPTGPWLLISEYKSLNSRSFPNFPSLPMTRNKISLWDLVPFWMACVF